jgi:ferredoxin
VSRDRRRVSGAEGPGTVHTTRLREEGGIVFLLDAAPSADLHDAVRECVNVCPAGAIRVSEEA